MHLSLPARLALGLSFASFAGATLAAELPATPAAAEAAYCRDIDPNTFRVGHPASPRWVVHHANGEHPAVIVAREAAAHAGAVDPNTFIVQPPASVTWLEHGDDVAPMTVAAR